MINFAGTVRCCFRQRRLTPISSTFTFGGAGVQNGVLKLKMIREVGEGPTPAFPAPPCGCITVPFSAVSNSE
jgi:hypothetical protein